MVIGFANEWRYYGGPGVDDPLIGLLRKPNGTSRRLYYVTDGSGRQLVVADDTGALILEDIPGSASPGPNWRYAGGTSSATTFGADRLTSLQMPSVSLFRNRAYDQRTGRWTQEDPMGVSTGLNLYQFNGNNPVAFTDPFGLCPIPPSSCFQQLADWGARQGGGIIGTIALNAGAAGAAAYDVLGGGDAENAVSPLTEGRFVAAAASAFFALPGGKGAKAGGEVLQRAAGEIAERIGRNSVSIKLVDGGIKRVDLVGRPHGGVAHVQEYRVHTNPQNGKTRLSREGGVRPATPQDLREVRRVTE